jgi:peptidyl-tRNA hydrolase, PTH1 family
MNYIYVGLGNPGSEYENTRHNTGRMVLEFFRKKHDLPDWTLDKKKNALVSSGTVIAEDVRNPKKAGKKVKVDLILPETFMNKSGNSLTSIITSAKKAAQLVVIHDDLDLPIGRFKISWNKSSGGHRGVESIIKAVKTEMFARVRVGISAATAKGVVKKPIGEEAVTKCIIGAFKPAEFAVLKKEYKTIASALESIALYGPVQSMSYFNGL